MDATIHGSLAEVSWKFLAVSFVEKSFSYRGLGLSFESREFSFFLIAILSKSHGKLVRVCRRRLVSVSWCVVGWAMCFVSKHNACDNNKIITIITTTLIVKNK